MHILIYLDVCMKFIYTQYRKISMVYYIESQCEPYGEYYIPSSKYIDIMYMTYIYILYI